MEIFVEKSNKNIDRKYSGPAKDLLSALGINPETVIIVKDGCIITEDEVLQNTAKIRLLSVISGG